MPLYEYECNDCGEEFEKMVPFSQANQNQPCPACQGEDTHRKISTIASRSNSLNFTSTSSSSSCGSRGGFS